MPKYTKQFDRPGHYDHEIQTLNGMVVGTLRVKPVGVLWRPKSKGKFYSVSLDEFTDWIMSKKTEARRTSS